VRRARERLARVGRVSSVLGAAVLVGSSVSVLATANTPPHITSASLSRSVINEGETVTLTGAFTDPDVGDAHDVEIDWHDHPIHTPNQKLHLPPGQMSFSATHRYTDNNHSIPPGASLGMWVGVRDRQLRVGSNDNSEGSGWDERSLTLQVNNVAPSFGHTISVTKPSLRPPGTVRVEGTIVDPGADSFDVSATWETAEPRPGSACIVTGHGRQFVCEHTYSTSPASMHSIHLYVTDDDGGQGMTATSVSVP
jgi:hypothetical protein